MASEHLDWRIDDYVDDRLDAEERRRVEEHLARCPACRAEYEATLALREELGALPRLEAPAGFKDVLMARLAASGADPDFPAEDASEGASVEGMPLDARRAKDGSYVDSKHRTLLGPDVFETSRPNRRRHHRIGRARWAGMAASLAVVALTVYLLFVTFRSGGVFPAEDAARREVAFDESSSSQRPEWSPEEILDLKKSRNPADPPAGAVEKRSLGYASDPAEELLESEEIEELVVEGKRAPGNESVTRGGKGDPSRSELEEPVLSDFELQKNKKAAESGKGPVTGKDRDEEGLKKITPAGDPEGKGSQRPIEGVGGEVAVMRRAWDRLEEETRNRGFSEGFLARTREKSEAKGETGHDKVIGDAGDRVIGDAGDRVIGDAGDRVIGDAGDRAIGDAGDRVIGDAGDRAIREDTPPAALRSDGTRTGSGDAIPPSAEPEAGGAARFDRDPYSGRPVGRARIGLEAAGRTALASASDRSGRLTPQA